jgi:hypothetical protein
MKNILTYIVLFLTFNVYGQNNSKIVNLDSINFYFGEKLNAERIKLGKPTVSYNQKLSAVELDWIDNYFQYIIKQEDEIEVLSRTQALNLLRELEFPTGKVNVGEAKDILRKLFTESVEFRTDLVKAAHGEKQFVRIQISADGTNFYDTQYTITADGDFGFSTPCSF